MACATRIFAVVIVLMVPEKNMHSATTTASTMSPRIANFLRFMSRTSYFSSVSWMPVRMSLRKYR